MSFSDSSPTNAPLEPQTILPSLGPLGLSSSQPDPLQPTALTALPTISLLETTTEVLPGALPGLRSPLPTDNPSSPSTTNLVAPVFPTAGDVLTGDRPSILPNESLDELLPNPSLIPYTSGYFTTDSTGNIGIDYLFDGGGYRGQLALFSLEGMEAYTPGSPEFIKEAARRALSESELGYIVIDDPTEGARFDGKLGENSQNSGDYKGVKQFKVTPNGHYAFMLVPNGLVADVFKNPAIGGDKRPLFSLVTANPNAAFHVGQIVDVTGTGNTFVFEDLRMDKGSDRDYNDIIFQVRNAYGVAERMDDWIAPGKDWRTSNLGKALIEYTKPYITPIVDILPIPIPSDPSILEPPAPALPDPSDSVFPPVPTPPPVDSQPVPPVDPIVPVPPSQPPVSSQPVVPVLPGELIVPPIPTSGLPPAPLFDPIDVPESSHPLVPAPNDYNFPIVNQPLIGIIDTGFAANNPDINYSRITSGYDWVANDNNSLTQPGEDDGHGDHILGIIAATRDNGIGIEGINDQAPLWVGRAIGSGQWAESLVEYVDHFRESGQPNGVVNLSLDLTQINPDGSVTTRYELTPQERSAIEYARQSGVLLVVAAGNDGGVMSALGQASQEFDNIITVGAAERVNEEIALAKAMDRSDYSSYGYGLDIVAPGGTAANPELSTVGDDLGTMAGTSVATAKVTGAISQVWAANPELSYRQVIEILKSTATDLNDPGWDTKTGTGLVNVAAAVSLAKATEPEVYNSVAFSVPTTWGGSGLTIPIERAAADQFNGKYYDWDRYTVRSGDTLSAIALRTMESGTAPYYNFIAQKNGISNPNLIYVGQQIWIPREVAAPIIPPIPNLNNTVGYDGASVHQTYINTFNRNGGSTVLGSPTNNVHPWANGYTQDFGGGSEGRGVIMKSNANDNSYWVGGEFWNRFLATGGATGILGYPTSDRYATSGGQRQNFQGGAILQSAQGTFPVFGGIGAHYLNNEGGQAGRLGFPTSGEIGIGNGVIIQNFENGRIVYGDGLTRTEINSQPVPIPNPQDTIRQIFSNLTSQNPWLGTATSLIIDRGNGFFQQNFENGYIVWNGVNAVAYRTGNNTQPVVPPTPTPTPEHPNLAQLERHKLYQKFVWDVYENNSSWGEFYRVENFGLNFADGRAGFYAVGLVPTLEGQARGLKPILVIRGTEPGVDDLYADADPRSIGMNQFLSERSDIQRWLEAARRETGQLPDVTGHSLGGALAQIISANFPNSVGETVTFNSPGISRDLAAQYNKSAATHYIVSGDIVSMAGEAYLNGVVRFYKYDDPFPSWDMINPTSEHFARPLNASSNLPTMPVSQLSDPLFSYNDRDYFAFLTVLALSSALSSTVSVPLATFLAKVTLSLITRGTTEQIRKQEGFVLTSILKSLREGYDSIKEKGLLQAVGDLSSWLVNQSLDVIRKTLEALFKYGLKLLELLRDYGLAALQAVLQFGQDAINFMRQWGKQALDAITRFGQDAINFMRQWGKQALDAITRFGQDAINFMRQWGKQALDAITRFGQDAINFMRQWGKQALDAITRFGQDAINFMRQWGKQALDAITRFGQDAINFMRQWGKQALDAITRFGQDAINFMRQWGKQALDAITRFGQDAINFMRQWGKQALDAITRFGQDAINFMRQWGKQALDAITRFGQDAINFMRQWGKQALDAITRFGQDAINFMRQWGKQALDAITRFGQDAINFMRQWGKQALDAITRFGQDAINFMRQWGKQALDAITRFGQDAINFMRQWGKQALDAITRFGQDAINFMRQWGKQALDAITRFGQDAINFMRQWGKQALDAITRFGQDAINFMRQWGKQALDAITRFGQDAINFMRQWGKQALDAITRFGQAAIDLIRQHGSRALDAISRFGQAAIGLIRQHGSRALDAISRFGQAAIDLIRQHGSRALDAISRFGQAAINLIRQHGSRALDAISRFGQAAIDLIRQHGSRALDAISRFGQAAIDLIRQHGSRALDAISRFGQAAIDLIRQFGARVIDPISRFGQRAIDLIRQLGTRAFRLLGV